MICDDGVAQCHLVEHITLDHFGTELAKLVDLRRRPRHRNHAVALRRQQRNESHTYDAGCAGEENSHRGEQ